MKPLSILSAILLLLAIANLPIGYYTFLRFFITVSAVIIIYNDRDKGINYSNIAFGCIVIMFNPIIPVYLYEKNIWIPIDVFCSSIFIGKVILSKS